MMTDYIIAEIRHDEEVVAVGFTEADWSSYMGTSQAAYKAVKNALIAYPDVSLHAGDEIEYTYVTLN